MANMIRCHKVRKRWISLDLHYIVEHAAKRTDTAEVYYWLHSYFSDKFILIAKVLSFPFSYKILFYNSYIPHGNISTTVSFIPCTAIITSGSKIIHTHTRVCTFTFFFKKKTQ